MALQAAARKATRVGAGVIGTAALSYTAFGVGVIVGVTLLDRPVPKFARRVAVDVLHSPVCDVWEVRPDPFDRAGGLAATYKLYRETRVFGGLVRWKDPAGFFCLWVSDGTRQQDPIGVASFMCISVDGAHNAHNDEEERARVESKLWDRMMSTAAAAGATTLFGVSQTPELSPRMASMGFVVVREDIDGANGTLVKLELAAPN